jgi:hypothetical protein|tara:strand:+ start:2574 stop:2912 length:339 start_codon:yes stop_codon:yes gene_type:complete
MAEQDMMAPMPPQGMPPEAMPPEMQGALPPEAMPPEMMATEAMMAPDPDVTAIIASRLSAMDPTELELLDAAITPEVAQVLTKLLPELESIINMIDEQEMQPQQMGALGGVV